MCLEQVKCVVCNARSFSEIVGVCVCSLWVGGGSFNKKKKLTHVFHCLGNDPAGVGY